MCCSCQLHELQRQRESCSLEVRDMEEELATLSQRKQTLKDRAFTERVMKPESSNISFDSWLCSVVVICQVFFSMLHFSVAPLFHKQPSVVMSVLEREEMDRQLDSAKTELFAEQRRAREKLESMQEVLR